MKIAIDGPAGAGKSTLARSLARKLGFVHIDTGAMYRALTWKALCAGIDMNNPDLLAALASSLEFHFETHHSTQRIFCDGQDLTELIRSPEVTEMVSLVATHTKVRAIMVEKQKIMAAANNVIMDGRDIGEQVLPDAEFKFFLTADLDHRAYRRVLEMKQQGYHMPRDIIKNELEKRDRLDSEREVGALKVLPDSIVIDTSSSTADEVLQQILALVTEN